MSSRLHKWKQLIPNYKSLDNVIGIPGYYITDNGKVFNKHWKLLKLNHDKNSWYNPKNCYPELQITHNKKTKHFRINRLIIKAFTNLNIDDKEIHHKDKNTFNNCLSNLQILTPEEHKQIHHHRRS